MLFLCTLARARIHFFPIFFSLQNLRVPAEVVYIYLFFVLRRTRSSGVSERPWGRWRPHCHGRGVLLTWYFWKDSGSRENRFPELTSSIFLFPVRFTRRSSGNLMGGRYYAYASAKIDEKFRGNSSLASAPPPLLIFTLLLFCQKFLSIFCVFHLFIYFPRFYLTTYPSLSLLL